MELPFCTNYPLSILSFARHEHKVTTGTLLHRRGGFVADGLDADAAGKVGQLHSQAKVRPSPSLSSTLSSRQSHLSLEAFPLCHLRASRAAKPERIAAM